MYHDVIFYQFYYEIRSHIKTKDLLEIDGEKLKRKCEGNKKRKLRIMEYQS